MDYFNVKPILFTKPYFLKNSFRDYIYIFCKFLNKGNLQDAKIKRISEENISIVWKDKDGSYFKTLREEKVTKIKSKRYNFSIIYLLTTILLFFLFILFSCIFIFFFYFGF